MFNAKKFMRTTKKDQSSLKGNILDKKLSSTNNEEKKTELLLAQIKKQSTVPTYTIKADQKINFTDNLLNVDTDYVPPLKEITGLQFTLLSPDEIEKMSVLRITEQKLTGENSVSDPRLGTITNYNFCRTCGGNWKTCPGHPGYIKLPNPIPHPIRLKQIADILTCVCQKCHRLVLTNSKMKLLQIFKYKGEQRFNAYLAFAKRMVVRCPHCKEPHGKYIVVDDKFQRCYKIESKPEKIPVFYDEVVEIIRNIREKDYKYLGFTNPYSHPTNMIISNLLVLPPCVIPYVESNGSTCEDDLKYKYGEINKKVQQLEGPLKAPDKEKEREDCMDSIMFHIKTLMDNSKNKARDPQGKRGLRSIKQRMTSKGGLIRQNIQAKRSDLTARSVVSPNPDGHVNEVTIPLEIAKKVPYPEEVNQFNIKRCQQLLEDGKVSRIIRGGKSTDTKYAMYTQGFKIKSGDIVVRDGERIIATDNFQLKPTDQVFRKTVYDENKDKKPDQVKSEVLPVFIEKRIENIEPPKRKHVELKIGDIIERDREDGDWTIFNRQPTLWAPSVRAKQIKIGKSKTFSFELGSTAAYGADFDGDEMNLFPATSSETSTEMRELMSTLAQFINESDSKPVLSFKQDNMLGGYVYTLGRVPVEKHTFMDACCKTDWDTGFITEKIEHVRNVHKWQKLLDPEMKIVKEKIDTITKEIPEIRKKMYDLRNLFNKPTTSKIDKVGYKNEFDYLKSTLRHHKFYLDQVKGKTVEEIASDNLLYTGYGLFSVLLPQDFEYTCDTKLHYKKCPIDGCKGDPFYNVSGDPKGLYCEVHKLPEMFNVRLLKIKRGVILSGTINKTAIGSSSGSLIHHLFKDYGATLACDFVTYYQRFTNLLLERHGFSVGIEDCIPKNTNLMNDAQKKCFLEAKHVMETEKDPEVKEAKILGLLNSSTNIGETIAQESLNRDNNFVAMITSGAKGSMFNITHITSAIGQQNVEGKRISKNCNDRSLPHFQREQDIKFDQYDDNELELKILKRLFQSRGYITSSFYHGLTSQEYYFLSAGGREGLTDTSIKTAKCGYISRRILKLLEDVKISYNGNVVNARGNIVQFCYGDDNYSAGELIKTEKYGYQATDVSHVADMLNSEFEWENKI